jgi:hypothetical protein
LDSAQIQSLENWNTLEIFSPLQIIGRTTPSFELLQLIADQFHLLARLQDRHNLLLGQKFPLLIDELAF